MDGPTIFQTPMRAERFGSWSVKAVPAFHQLSPVEVLALQLRGGCRPDRPRSAQRECRAIHLCFRLGRLGIHLVGRYSARWVCMSDIEDN